MKLNNFNTEKIRVLYWEKNHNVDEIAKKLGVSVWTLYNFMRKKGLPRRPPTAASFLANKNKPQFETKLNIDIQDEKLKIAGLMLYWAEGTFNGNTVDLANSDPNIIRIFLRFLREICGIKEERLRIYLYTYTNQNLVSLKTYWNKITKVPLSQFTKPYVREGNPNVSSRKLLHGLVHVRYNDKRLLSLLERWLSEYIVIWTGTRVAKGDRL